MPRHTFQDLEWWLGFMGIYGVAAFVATILLQIARNGISAKYYLQLWRLLFLIGLIWGGIAVVEYIPNAGKWREEVFVVCQVAMGICIAKVKEWLRIKTYFLFLVITLLLPHFITAVVSLYKAIWGCFEQSDIGTMGSGGVGYGLGSGLGGGLESIDWLLYRLPGLVLLVCVLSVPVDRSIVRRMFKRLLPREGK